MPFVTVCILGLPCDPIIENSFALSDCVSNGLIKLCHETKDIGSKVTTTCHKGYDTRSPIVHTCQPNGEWWPPVSKCNAICGRTPSLPYIPWLASIYVPTGVSLPLIGSGVIVSGRVVLTYAHENYDLFTRNISTLEIYAAVIHYFDNYNTDNQQFRRAVDRFLHQNPLDYSDKTFAVLIMNKPFALNVNYVAPVCLDFSASYFNYNNGAFQGETGSVAAYVSSLGRIAQNSYKILDNFECKSSDSNIDRELARGKMCAKRPEMAGGINCTMVEGTGLVVSKIENEVNVHYLKGIAMKGFQTPLYNRCVEDEFQLFMNINYFKNIIQKYITEYN